jgi:DNA-binding NtrC family response regulator
MKAHVLVVDSDLLSRRTIAVMLDGFRHTVLEAASIEIAVATVSTRPVDVVLSGRAFGRTCGAALLAAIRNIRPEIPVAVIGEADPEQETAMVVRPAPMHGEKHQRGAAVRGARFAD